MLRNAWTWPCLLLLVLATGCNSCSLTNLHPEISVTPAAVDFGTVSPSATLSKQVTVANMGSALLVIHSVAVTANPEEVFGSQNTLNQVGAGMSGTVTVSMSAPAESGVYGASLTISSNATNAPQVLVQLSVQVGPPDGGVDAGTPDAGAPDSGFDAGMPDSGPIDAGAPDAGPVDAGVPDAGSDAGIGDAGELDAGACPSGQMVCSGNCVDPRSDFYNCGTCGNRCDNLGISSTTGLGCSAGTCMACAPTTGYVTLASNQGQPYDLAVDTNNVYWTAQVDETVVKVGHNGGAPNTLATASEFMFPAAFQPTTIAIDSGDVYTSNLSNQDVVKIPFNSGIPISLAMSGTNGLTGAWPGKIGVTSTAVYWVITTTGELWRAPLPDGPATSLVPAPSPSVGGQEYDLLGVDATSVYWYLSGDPSSNFQGAAVMKVGLNGGTPTTVVSGLTFVTGGTVDSSNVYWVDYVGDIVKAPSSGGGTPVTLATGLDGPRRLVTDGTNAYWSAGGTDGSLMDCSSTVQSVGLNGGPVVDLVTGQYSAYGVAVDSTSVYWTDLYYGTVMRTPK